MRSLAVAKHCVRRGFLHMKEDWEKYDKPLIINKI